MKIETTLTVPGYSVVVEAVKIEVYNLESIILTFAVMVFIISEEARTVGLLVTVCLAPVVTSTLNSVTTSLTTVGWDTMSNELTVTYSVIGL